MVWSAVLPGAALRVMRTAAGRRALRVGLLVGGLFVLGVVCGQRADAAGGAPSPTETVGRVLATPAQSPRGVGSAGDAGSITGSGPGAVLTDLRPVSGDVVRAVEDRVVRPVGDTVETLTEELGAVARAEVPPLEALPTLPLPSAPPLPVLPDPADPSDRSDSSDRSVSSDLADSSDPNGSTDSTDDLSGRSRSAVPESRPDPSSVVPDVSRSGGPPDAVGSRVRDGAASPARVGYGPEPGGDAEPAAHVDTRRAVPAEYAPAHRAPSGDPDGELGTASGADQGATRHGDARAVTPDHRIPFRLVPDAPEHADAAGAGEPYRDIPVSPA
ncbi:hypothetical protein [Streptomyces sp. NPDC048392]|uniref:hypothetical protein n=1 Tax=Streptomyces sp. NPDC048392 TaxID=3365543 RepID=UPI00370FFAE4